MVMEQKDVINHDIDKVIHPKFRWSFIWQIWETYLIKMLIQSGQNCTVAQLDWNRNTLGNSPEKTYEM
jgi:hypothetical protein